MEYSKDIATIFKALCDETRVSIILYLQTGEKCACTISRDLNIAQSKLSYHMKILCESGLVTSWYVGKWTHYRMSEEGFEHAMTILKELKQCKLCETENGCHK
ncbi:MAG: metalloregulator ArsR/SmtB family transcription factor [Erysipelotrichaceae bacterium]